MGPSYHLLHKKGSEWTPHMQGCLKSVMIGGQWTQDRLYQAGLVSAPTCAACGGDVGTLHHRFWCCPATHRLRKAWVSEDTLAEAERAPADHPFWSRGWWPCADLPALPAIPP